jgi:aerobic-type carbon monoxide dehydrogenase small subunit (CoxS/CutS family)
MIKRPWDTTLCGVCTYLQQMMLWDYDNIIFNCNLICQALSEDNIFEMTVNQKKSLALSTMLNIFSAPDTTLCGVCTYLQQMMLWDYDNIIFNCNQPI